MEMNTKLACSNFRIQTLGKETVKSKKPINREGQFGQHCEGHQEDDPIRHRWALSSARGEEAANATDPKPRPHQRCGEKEQLQLR